MYPINPPVLTVSELNHKVKTWLEQDIGEVGVLGEVSNFVRASSGHLYFTLKDTKAQIKAVYFKNKQTQLAYQLAEGQQVEAIGRLSLYEPRGDYQLIIDRIEEAGLGDLFRQFELLKEKLKSLGLFDQARKRALPKWVHTIGIITSPTGAALRDILTTLNRRYPLASVIIYPSEVQGKAAPEKLIQALKKANQEAKADVILLARGGGSLEDLWAFNDEKLAFAIAESVIPTVSGVGHETDFTIADFVADHRAATPTAAAVLVTPDKAELMALIEGCQIRMIKAVQKYLEHRTITVLHLKNRLLSPDTSIVKFWQTVDYLEKRLFQALFLRLNRQRHQLHILSHRLKAQDPLKIYELRLTKLNMLKDRLNRSIVQVFESSQQRLYRVVGKLDVVSPLATLARGYSITKKEGQIVFKATQLKPGDKVNIVLAQGQVDCEVQSVLEHLHA